MQRKVYVTREGKRECKRSKRETGMEKSTVLGREERLQTERKEWGREGNGAGTGVNYGADMGWR